MTEPLEPIAALAANLEADRAERLARSQRAAALATWRAERTRRQMLFLFALLFGLGVAVAIHSQINDDAIEATRIEACQARNIQFAQFNSSRESLGLLILALTPTAAQADKDAFMTGMENSKILPPEPC